MTDDYKKSFDIKAFIKKIKTDVIINRCTQI